MNRKVFVSMLALCVSFLAGCYFLKIFFPQEFVMAISNEKIIAIGNFVDSHKWAYYIFGSIFPFITYWCYLCATCRKPYLKWKEALIVIGSILFSYAINEFDANMALQFSYCIMIILPCVLGAKLKEVSIVFSIHILSQYLSLQIRGLPLLLTSVNFATVLLMGLESYIWLALFYIIFNYKKE